MKILVTIKRVADPDNASKLKVSADGKSVTSEGLEWKMNPFDDWSLEAALRLTENAAEKNARVGEVVLVSIGPNDEHTQRIIREGLAKGAERGILVEAEEGSLDAGVVAVIIKAIADKESPDLIVMGKQAADGDSNVAGTRVAEKLGWPIINYAMKIKTSDDGKTFEVLRELDTGVATVKVTGPAVFTTSDRILHPESIKNGVTPDDHQYAKLEVGGRYASLKGIMQAKKKTIDQMSIADLGVDPAKALNYTKFELPPARSGETTFVEDAADLVDKLHNTAKVI
ncbi:MAG: electron transfer flavoprotein subunit beta/FixA family protein [Deltaproteobacteria bacterium]|nr:electron transfer flavoprotein subunit beta/FixA family protein [Deltaproteobacteria bacterium]MBW2223885.1 electron transfer flavoprotein subunit beta/FixA family protein [Deltaproteobacteria bacterium]MBW2403435.1 electron transfer flavoprotein subunit beta/FixA family protein [Deltaproteobacteria bacterium]MBW2548123.1 electron transfer flavoprotein subunit beta/FixA family protein [Deltaproteobacteria bacterium]MBW2719970.1 electron transfer flavoprotein subunit beta/FixA family protein 